MPTAPTPAPLTLIFTTTSLRNVTIATAEDEYYYEIVTADWEPLITKVRRLDSESGQMSLIVEMKKEDANSHYTKLRFVTTEKPDPEFFPVGAFFSTDGAGEKALGSFNGEDGKRYCWQMSGRSVELVQSDEPEKSLARFHKHHRHLGVLRMSEKPFLEVDAKLAESMNAFIVSFLLAEGKRRQ